MGNPVLLTLQRMNIILKQGYINVITYKHEKWFFSSGDTENVQGLLAGTVKKAICKLNKKSYFL